MAAGRAAARRVVMGIGRWQQAAAAAAAARHAAVEHRERTSGGRWWHMVGRSSTHLRQDQRKAGECLACAGMRMQGGRQLEFNYSIHPTIRSQLRSWWLPRSPLLIVLAHIISYRPAVHVMHGLSLSTHTSICPINSISTPGGADAGTAAIARYVTRSRSGASVLLPPPPKMYPVARHITHERRAECVCVCVRARACASGAGGGHRDLLSGKL